MNTIRLALRNIRGSGWRSLAIFLCVMGIASFLLSTSLIINGAQNSLDVGLRRLGADIVVVPEGTETKVETALLMGKPTSVWMDDTMLERVRSVPGVERVSPQIYLSSLYGAACCSVSEMFIVVFDPETDFAIQPWLERKLGRDLRKGEVIGGTYIFVPDGEKSIKLYGSELVLRGNLEPTGTGLDQTMFMTRETAESLAASSVTMAESPLEIPPGKISSVMVKVTPGLEPHKVALKILLDILGVFPIESPNLFGAFRNQMTGLLWGFLAILVAMCALSAVLIGLVFSMAASERRREIAVLRALGATRNFIFGSVVTEAVLLAIGGGIPGVILGAAGIYIFRNFIAGSLKMPFLFPSVPSLLMLLAVGLIFSLATVTLSALSPALRVSREEPAIAMRE